MLRVGMLSGWHVHARGYAEELQNIPNVRIMAVWDELAERGKEWAAGLGVPFEPELRTFLGRDDVDAVVVDAPTNRHAEVMVAAAQAGKHIFTEKAMALTVLECDEIAEAVRKAGVKFCISFPARTTAKHLFAKRVVDEKLIGDVTFLRVRVAHNGASAGWLPPHFYDAVQCGGGAMMDLGAHPMYLARWLGGKPSKVSSTFNYFTEHAVEDNAVSVIEFENKCIGVAETSFVTSHSPDCIELHGTAGGLFVGGPEDQVRIFSEKLGGKLRGWLRPADLPAPLPRPIRIWANGILENTPIPFGLEEGTQLTALMEAAYQSHRQGSTAVPVSR
jgi:1,5-anhydro-D-fructose reductase (1,5-anhydro-D-mannitol-forming)